MSFPILGAGSQDFSPYKILGSHLNAGETDQFYYSGGVRATFTAKFTYSVWVKRANMVWNTGGNRIQSLFYARQAASTGSYVSLAFPENDTIVFGVSNGNDWIGYLGGLKLFQDASDWYHIVAVFDSTQAVASERMKLFVNGLRLSIGSESLETELYPALNTQVGVMYSGWYTCVNGNIDNYNQCFDGSITEAHLVMDQSGLDCYSFGDFNSYGTWQPKKYTGPYGSGGFYMPFNKALVNYAWPNMGATYSSPVARPEYPANNARFDDGTFFITQTSTGSSFDALIVDLGVQTELNSIRLQEYRWTGGNATGVVQYSNDGVNWTTGTTFYLNNSYNTAQVAFNFVCRYVKIRMTQFGTNGDFQIEALWPFQNQGGMCDESGNNVKFYPTYYSPLVDEDGLNNRAYSFYSSLTYDVPTISPGAMNYGRLNSRDNRGWGNSTGFPTLQSASTAVRNLSNGSRTSAQSSFVIPTYGKWQFEALIVSLDTTINLMYIGVRDADYEYSTGNQNFYWQNTNTGGYPVGIFNSAGTQLSSVGYTAGDILSFCIDRDNGTYSLFKNGTLVHSWTDTWNFDSVPFIYQSNLSGSRPYVYFNLGMRDFVYPQAGYHGLGKYWLTESPIYKPSKYVAVNTWLGDGVPPDRSFTNDGFQPDLLIAKDRLGGNQHFQFYTSVRGPDKFTETSTNAEYTTGSGLTSFDSNGFTINNDNPNNRGLNINGRYYVGWSFKKSPLSGIDIVTYTGTGVNTSVAHNLGRPPEFIIFKNLTTGGYNWIVYNKEVNRGSTYWMYLNAVGGLNTNTNMYTSEPSSTDFYPGTNNNINRNGDTYQAILFASVPGFSKVSWWSGNGSPFGPYVYTGFKPKIILLKDTGNAASSWAIVDSERDRVNVCDRALFPGSSTSPEGSTGQVLNILSNGYQIMPPASSPDNLNVGNNGITAIAFADDPFKYTLAR